MRATSSRGFTLIELMFVCGLVATLGAVGLASLVRAHDDVRAVGATRAIAALLQRTRAEAVARHAHIALRVTTSASGDVLTRYVDGDGDGVLSSDIGTGTDFTTGTPFHLGVEFPGVAFGALPGLPAIEPSGTPPGSDPVRLGASDMAVFTPLGTATSGTLYLLGRGRIQLAVRIFGETGRTRVLRFDEQQREWQSLGGW